MKYLQYKREVGKLHIYYESAKLGYEYIKQTSSNETISTELIDEYYDSPGIQFLEEHLLKYGGFQLTKHTFVEILYGKFKDSVFDLAIQQAKVRLNSEIFKCDYQQLEEQILNEVAKYSLIDISKININVYLLFGIRGTSVVWNNKIAVDLCDSALYENEILSESRIISMMAHEIHHMCFDSYRKENNIKNEGKESIISGLIAEGIAYVFFTPWLNQEPNVKVKWDINYVDIEEKIQKLEIIFENDMSEVEIDDLQVNLFGESLLGYTIGYHMIQRIYEMYGKGKVLSLMKTLDLFNSYNLC